jgi:hypothetical protein
LTDSATVETTKEEETKWPQNAQEAQEAEFSRRGAKARRRGFDVELRKKKPRRKFLPLRIDKGGSKSEQSSPKYQAWALILRAGQSAGSSLQVGLQE